MELKRNEKKRSTAALGAAGLAAMAAACVGCCLPLLAPLLASLGLAGVGAAAMGWYAGGAGLLLAGATLFMMLRKRRSAACRPRTEGACGCASSCKTP